MRRAPPTTKTAKRMRVNRAGLHERAADRLRFLIVRGELAPGNSINEAEISAALGISRTPLREALKLLSAEGLIALRPNRSAQISIIEPDEIEQLFEAVGGIERIAAELAAQRATARDLQKLRRLQQRMERCHERGSLNEYFDLNQQVHRHIVGCARNTALTSSHDFLLARAQRARFFALSASGRWDVSVLEHRAVLAALEVRDSSLAGQLLDEHVRRTGMAVLQVLHGRIERNIGQHADREGSTDIRTAL